MLKPASSGCILLGTTCPNQGAAKCFISPCQSQAQASGPLQGALPCPHTHSSLLGKSSHLGVPAAAV